MQESFLQVKRARACRCRCDANQPRHEPARATLTARPNARCSTKPGLRGLDDELLVRRVGEIARKVAVVLRIAMIDRDDPTARGEVLRSADDDAGRTVLMGV